MNLLPSSSDLAGCVRLHPGAGLPAITSSRPELAPRLAPGRRADELPALLAALHSLCAQAHRLTAQAAVAAARGDTGTVQDPSTAQALRLATARDQVMRLAHDWPRQLPGGLPPGSRTEAAEAASATRLRACPLWRSDWPAEDRLAALPDWLGHHVLGQPVAAWLARHDTDPATWSLQWAHDAGQEGKAGSWLAQLLARQLTGPASALACATAGPTEGLLDGPPGDIEARMATLAAALADEPGFWQAPHLAGRVLDSGPWNRRHDPLRSGAAGGTASTASTTTSSAWARLVSRLVDLLRLATPGGDTWLARGALPLDGHAGIAWTEMARGLLIHWVRLDASGERVEACRVLAPTEWNFHPRGTLARALAALAGRTEPERHIAATRLAVAFDPCVDFRIEPGTEEPVHA